MLSLHLDIHDARAHDALVHVMHSQFPVAMLQLPSVFALIAPASAPGVNALNHAKQRLPGKHYGSAIGELSEFVALAEKDALPDVFRDDSRALAVMEGAFIRMRVANPIHETSAISAGTHQGLLLSEGPERSLFKAVERSFRKDAPNELFAGAKYYAPICTSANMSGDSLGSIVDLNRALSFALDTDIPLVISNENVRSVETGSYPIFAFEGNTVRAIRQGPAQERILRSLPSTITVR
jgi:tRNA A37 threonylcarbamoyladenosine synthetase subunit TsaC/SUA5/YrdC